MTLIKERKKQRSPLPILISIVLLAMAGGLFIIELTRFSQREARLPAGITVGGVRVGNLTEMEATSRINEAYTAPITLYYQDAPINLNPDAIGYDVNTPVMIAQARSAAETGSGFWGRFINYLLGQEERTLEDIDLQADYQRNELRDRLEEIARIYDRPEGSVAYDLNTLTISSGDVGYQMDIEGAMIAVDRALRSPDQRAVDLPIIGGESAAASLTVLEEMIRAYLDQQGFIYDGNNSVASIFVMDLTTGAEVNIQGDVAYSAASTSKVPILIDYFRQIERTPNQDDAWLMANSLLCSANSTSNLIMETILGGGNIFAGLASVTNTAQYIGAQNTFLTAPFIDGSANQQLGAIAAPDTQPNPAFNTYADAFNQTTAVDMGSMFALLYDCEQHGSGLLAAYPDEITQTECRQMLELMSANDLQRLLQAGIPADVRISHKNGWIPGRLAGARGAMVADAGVVYSPNGRDYVISVYLWEETDGTGFDRWELVEEISRMVWNYFNPERPMPQRRSDLPPSANECFTQSASGERQYNYLPPYGQVDLDNINGWRDGTATTPQPLPNQDSGG